MLCQAAQEKLFFLSNYFTGTEAAAARAVGHTESAVPKRKTERGS